MDHSLNQKVVIVAGGAKNLGALISKACAEEGAKVVIHYNSDSTKGAAEQTAAEITAIGGESVLIQGDLTQIEQVKRLFDIAEETFGKVHIAINTTGMVIKKPLIEVDESDYDKIFEINSKAAFFFMQEAGKRLEEGGKICTILTSLLGAFTGYYSIYAGSKAPVEHFTRAASKEFGLRGISVTAIAPGPMDTPFFYGQESPEAVQYHQSAADLSRYSKTGLTDAEDIVPFVTFLITKGWWMTGQTILVNGGYTTK